MNYLELNINADPDFAEILMAELSELNFESFVETDEGLQAYVQDDLFDESATKRLLEEYAERTPISYTIKQIEKQNWNEEWERNFQPIEIGKKIYVRADFHESKADEYEHEIIITPKMSFGTGHHETTSMVMEHQLGIDHQNKKALDIGTGTGILAVLAAKLGIDSVYAFDIDEWSVENTIENIQQNGVSNIEVEQGTIESIRQDGKYEILLANINRNILLREIPIYRKFMTENGILIVSGFYQNDIAEIEAVAESVGLKKTSESVKNQWASVVFRA
jgi:ribosomal protein L11 methyltransferase